MKIKWSAFISILALATFVGCGSEQFGTTPQSSTQAPDPIKEYQQYSCSDFTLVKPKVDIIYMLDNTQSYYYSSTDIKNAVNGTLNSISSQFDYRIITTTLVNPSHDLINTYQNYNSSEDNSDFRVLTNSETALPSSVASKKVISTSELTSFYNVLEVAHMERGLWRLKKFMDRHIQTGLLRQGAYQLVVIVSNKFDGEVEGINSNSSNYPNDSVFTTRFNQLNSIKTQLQAPEFRLFSVTAKTSGCREGWWASTYSYTRMSQAFNSGDSFDLCSGNISSIFSAVNSTIKQVEIPHVYRFWPVKFVPNDTTSANFVNFEVRKVSSNGTSTLIPATDYTKFDNGASGADKNILTTNYPNPVQIVKGVRHFIEFKSGAEVTYPDCVLVKSTSRTEYFGYIKLDRAPQVGTIYVTINGRVISQSATNGWTYLGNTTVQNTKVETSDPNDSISPATPATGFILQLNGESNYYKSGDNVQVNFIPSAI